MNKQLEGKLTGWMKSKILFCNPTEEELLELTGEAELEKELIYTFVNKAGNEICILDFYISEEQPAYVDMPIWYTHNIKNIGETELYTMFWINEFYDPNDADTYLEVV